MITGKKGKDIIKYYESLSLTAYRCPAGILTIGYGHTGKDVYEGMTITNEEADALLSRDLVRTEQGITKYTSVELSQEQFDALVSFAFNVGVGNYRSSTLRMKLNRGEYDSASEEFVKWNKAGGRVLAGLTLRRLSEQELFQQG